MTSDVGMAPEEITAHCPYEPWVLCSLWDMMEALADS